jgi:glutathione peroxidase
MRIRNRLLVSAAFAAACASLCAAKPTFQPDVIQEPTTMPAPAAADNQPASPLDFTVTTIDGKPQKLSDFRGKVVMIVNVASKCGFTPQYKALEAIYKKYAGQGFVILGFPANDFAHQEPGTNAQILEFCTGNFDVTFPMMAKIVVKGDGQAPLYQYLTEKTGPFLGPIEWNFTKFLIDRNGNVIARYNSPTKPDDKTVTDEIEKALVVPVAGPTTRP